MNCPKCGGTDIEQSGKFDLTEVNTEECRHDFECENCGAWLQIIYAPIKIKVVERGEETD